MNLRGLLLLLLSLIFPASAFAAPVINEVLWAGSDISTSDEWIEIYNPDEEDIDLSGWTVTTLSSKGEHVVALRFATGTILSSDSYMVIARKDAASSRLLEEPTLIVPSLTLLNTNLQLRLYDNTGALMDEVDDGSGAPFAGANPSGGGEKASMERVSAKALGNAKENWKTAVSSFGFDEGSPLFGTPGFSNSSSDNDASGGCIDPLEISIAVQSGNLSGQGKVTVNFQALALAGSLTSASCSWDYGDGYRSTSCNPPSHTFQSSGLFTVRLDVTNACGETQTKTQGIEVFPDATLSVASSTYDDGSKLLFVAALPNPEGADTGREWIEIRNAGEKSATLEGWKIRIGETSSKWVKLKGSIAPHEKIRIYDTEIKLNLPNTKTSITLFSPAGQERSSIEWNKAEEGREYYPIDLKNIPIRGRVFSVIGSTVLEVQLEPDAVSIAGTDIIYVKLIGLKPVPTNDQNVADDRMEFLSDIAKGKTIEIEPESELWDSLGRLLGVVYTDRQFPLQHELLISKKWMVDRSIDFARKKEFLALESPTILASLLAEEEISASALEEEKKVPSIQRNKDSEKTLYFSEIFPSPDPKLKSVTGSLLSQEWLEIGIESDEPLSLSGFTLQAGSRKKRLPAGLIVGSDSLLLISMTDLKLTLPNAGSFLKLLNPEGEILASLEYPKIATGTSYAITEEGDWCITFSPTPAQPNTCIDKKPVAAATKKPKAKSTKPSAAVKKYTAQYVSDLRSTDDRKDLVFSSAEPSSHAGIFLGIFGFLSGILATAGLLLFAFKKGYLVPEVRAERTL